MDQQGLGSTLGLVGGGAGLLFGGGPAGAALGMGAGQLLGNIFGKKPDVPEAPPMVDPMNQQMLDELYAKRRGIEMGTSTEFQTAREIIQRSEASALSDVSRITGGDVGGAVAASQRVLEAGGANVSKLVGQTTQMTTPYTQMINELLSKMSQRKRELGMASHLQGMAEKTQMQNNVNANLSSILSSKALWGGAEEGGSAVSKWVQGLFNQPTVMPEQIMNPVPYTNIPTYTGNLETSLQSHYGMDNSMEETIIGG